MRSIFIFWLTIVTFLLASFQIVQAQNVGIGTETPLQQLDINGGLRIGTTDISNTGAIRWNEIKSDFEGYNGYAWVSLTGGKGKWGDQAVFSTENEASQVILIAAENPGSELGCDIDGVGDYVIAGAFRDAVPTDPTRFDAGSIRMFIRNGDTWNHSLYAFDPDAKTNDFFGASVGMTSTHVIAGAYYADLPNGFDHGKAYIYTYTANQLTLQSTLVASDAQEDDVFGFDVSISGDYAVVGAPGNDIIGIINMGRAYVFTRSGTTWSQTFVLTPSDGAIYDGYGTTVKIWGDYLAIAAPNKKINGESGAGKVYVYRRNGSSWTLIQQIISTAPNANERFGSALEINDNKLFIGAPDNLGGSDDGTGMVLVYGLNNSNVTYETTLIPSEGKSQDGFGSHIDFLNNKLLVGASTATLGASIYTGKAYVYAFSNNQWIEEAKLKSSTSEMSMRFGKSVVLVPGFAVVGAPFADIPARIDNGQIMFFKQY